MGQVKKWGKLTRHDDIKELSVGEMLERSAKLCPGKEAVISGDRRVTYVELNRLVDQFAAGLTSLGYQKGERVAICLHNSLELVIAFYALARLGIITVWVNPVYRGKELEFIISNSGARGVIVKSSGEFDYAGAIAEMKNELPALENIIDVGSNDYSNGENTVAYTELINKGTLRADQRPDLNPHQDYLMLIYTSGATGVPKGAPSTHYQCIRAGCLYAETLDASADDIFIGFLPVCHSYAFNSILIEVIAIQATMVLMENYKVEEALQLIEKEKCTIHHAAPTHYIMTLKNSQLDKYDLSTLRAGFISGYVPPEELMEQIEEKLKIYFSNFWGSSETGPGLFSPLGAPKEKRYRTVGRPVEGEEIKIIDAESGQEKNPLEIGELTVRGWNVIKEYWNNPAETAVHIDAEGWLRTGDLAFQDAEGYVTVVGRTKDQINRGALKIVPLELEEELAKHPKVSEVCVVATPNPVLGESICVCIIPRPGQEITLEEVRDYLQDKIARNKLPDELCLMKEFPRLSGGVKLNKYGKGGIQELARDDVSREIYWQKKKKA